MLCSGRPRNLIVRLASKREAGIHVIIESVDEYGNQNLEVTVDMDQTQDLPIASGVSLSDSLAGGDASSDTESHVSFDEDDLPDGICSDYARVFPGPWNVKDEKRLLDQGWKERSRTEIFWWQRFVPHWTHPEWDPAIEITVDGTKTRASRGDWWSSMRPAILPADEEIARTGYTQYA